jgi:hypothetical protein
MAQSRKACKLKDQQKRDPIRSLIPTRFGSGNNVGGNIGDGFIVKTSSESRHGILSVGHLGNDGLLISATRQVGLKGFLLKSLVGHDHVLSSCVTCGAVGIEDLLSVSNIGGNSGLQGKSEGDGSSGGSLENKLEDRQKMSTNS